MLLGLDISTSCVGWCIFDNEKKFIDMGYLKLSSKLDMFDKASAVKKTIKNILKNYKVEKISIEENLQAFRPGLSSAKTLLTLARFNGIISNICFEISGIKPDYINVNSARKLIGLKINRKSKENTKEQVLAWVANDIADNGLTYHWQRKKLKRGPRAGIEVYETGCFDSADAYVICKASCV